MYGEVLLARVGDKQFDHGTASSLFRFRKDVFSERLGWNLNCIKDMEMDEYDFMKPLYLVAKEGKSVRGCARLLPTTGRYMVKDKFSDYFKGEEMPSNNKIWELSRFAATPGKFGSYIDHSLNPVTIGLFHKVYYFAIEHNIERYLVVTSLGMERLMRRAGLGMRRFGDGIAKRIGGDLAVACWLDINEGFAQFVFETSGEQYMREAA